MTGGFDAMASTPLPANAFASPPRKPFMPPPGLPGEPVDAPAREKPKAERAALRFLEPDTVMKSVPLKYPFAYEGADGEIEVREVAIRRLAVVDVAEIFNAARNRDDIDLFPFYAAMTGLPAAVLRAMPDDEEVIAACVPFLPQAAREMLELLIHAFGVATPSPAHDPAANPSAES